MSSVTKTFRCCLPLWTMKVKPTNSGVIVHERAQVVIGARAPEASCASTFFCTLASTYGPLAVLRLMSFSPGAYFLCLLRRMKRLVGWFFLRVRPPLEGTADGLQG